MRVRECGGCAFLGAVLLTVGTAVSASGQGVVAIEEAKLAAGDGEAGHQLGHSVSIDGDTAVVGALLGNGLVHVSGAAYVYTRQGATWTEQAKLSAADGSADDRFGSSVAVDGDTAVVGALRDDGAGVDSGSAYVFVRAGTTWTQQAKLTAADAAAGDTFGESVSVSGDTIVVGARTDDHAAGTDAGSAYVFVRLGTTWNQQAKLTAGDAAAGDAFGWSVSTDGDRAVVGSPFGGAAYVFVRSDTTWSQEDRLTPPGGALFGLFSRTVSISGDSVAAGYPFDDPSGARSGSAHVFTRQGTAWNHQATLTASDGAADDLFGFLALDGETLVVGALGDDNPATDTGSSYVFTRSGTVWTAQAKVSAKGAAADDSFGWEVGLSGDTAIVGAPFQDALGADSGTAYVYRLAAGSPGLALCFGDGSGAACPCGNDSTVPGEGCRHSGGVGMTITGSGTASIAADDLVLTANGCPVNNTGIFYSGKNQLEPASPLFDGLQCAGGETRRYQGLFQVTGSVSDTGFVAQDPSSVYFVSGETVFWQYWTRDVAAGASPCGTASNFSPAYAATLSP